MNHEKRKRSSVVYFWALAVTVVMLMTAVAGPLPGGGMEYTLDAEFDEGVLVGVEHVTVPDQLQLSEEHITLPFIWVPNMQGTVSKVNTENGDELGRYWVVPPGLPVENGSPSRTTVDLKGNCWVGNRAAGTVVKIGLYEAGNWIDRNEDGICQTSQDTNFDGDITGDELLPWGEDECVLYEVVLIPGKEGTYVPGTFVSGNAFNPSPEHEARNVPLDATLTWSPVNYAASHKVYFGIDPESLVLVATMPLGDESYDPPGYLEYSTTYYWQINEVDADTIEHPGPVWSFRTPVAGWSNQDVGNPDPAGSADYDSATGTWTITGNGHDIWDNSDNFHYVYRRVTGDCEIIARVVNFPLVWNTWQKTGVMIREELTGPSKHAMEIITGGAGGGESFQWRAITGSNSSHSSTHSGIAPPYWVRLVREGDTFSGYFSPDGVNWTQEGSDVTITMNSDVYIGLCVTSHTTGQLATAEIDNVSVTPYNLAWNPSPSNGALGVPTDAKLSWMPGDTATSHDVYFGTNPIPGVDEFKVNQTETTYDPGPLDPGTTYYWQINEVDADTIEHPGPVWSFTTFGEGIGKILREVWTDIGGVSISDLTSDPRYPDCPSFWDALTSFEAPIDWADNHGTRIHGYLHPQTSGDYTFWIASDDASELWLSTDEDPAHAVKIASVEGWCQSRDWYNTTGTNNPNQQSILIPLDGAQKYYIMALYKEGGGGDNLAVAWQGPDQLQAPVIGSDNAIIDGSYLSPYALPEPGATCSTSDGYDISLYDTDKWSTSPRGLAIDADNNLWAGTWSSKGPGSPSKGGKYYYIDGSTGTIIKSVDVSDWSHGAYGAVIDSSGVLWSAGHETGHVLRLDPSADPLTDPPTIIMLHEQNEHVYGLGLDYDDHLFVSGWSSNKFSKVDVIAGTKMWTDQKIELLEARGVACTSDNNVWVACTGPGMVYRYDHEGNPLTPEGIYVGSPAGVAVDAKGKVWSCNLNDENITRINPATNTVELEKQIIGSQGHYGYSDMTGIMARTITTRIGTWTVVYDSGIEDTPWGIVSWNSLEPEDTSVSVQVRSSNDQSTWSLPETASNGLPLSSTPVGRYLEIKTTLQIVSGEVSPILYDLTVNARPVANAGPDQTVECACNTTDGTKVTLDGTGSYDADGNPLTYTWTGPFVDSPTSGSNPTVTLIDGCPGGYEITLVVSDGEQNSDPDAVVITVEDTTPPVITCPDNVILECPADTSVAANGSATATDNCDDDPAITYGDVSVSSCGNTETITRTWTAIDEYGNSSSCVQTIAVVDTTTPVISNLDADYLLAAIGQTVTFSVDVLDECDTDVEVEWNFGDGTAASSNPSHEYELAGIYTVTITATDDCDNATTDSIIVVVYDPSAGFTTGGGWFVPDSDSFIDGVGVTDTVSKANFGFIVKYKKGADNPDGNLEFQYKAGDINLHSTDMEWLVVQSATKVRFKGNATINGEGSYTFKVTAEDNGEPGTGDRFKIEIWMGPDLDTENSPPTPKHKAQGFLGGGNIQIHQK